METIKEKQLHTVRKWFGFITEHTMSEVITSLILIMEGGDITIDMKKLGIPTNVFKAITKHLEHPDRREAILPILKKFSTASTETDDRMTCMTTYIYILLVDKEKEWGDDLIPILEWYEALYEWDIPTMKELDEKN